MRHLLHHLAALRARRTDAGDVVPDDRELRALWGAVHRVALHNAPRRSHHPTRRDVALPPSWAQGLLP